MYVAFLGLHPDETYYWDWTRSLSTGYFDHPPVVAWLAFVATAVFGATAFGVRSVAVFSSIVVSVAGLLLARRYVAKNSSSLLYLVLLNGILFYSIAFILLTPDAPLLLFWMVGLLVSYRALFDSSRLSWIILGVVAGAGLLSKYTFVLFPLSLALFLLIDRRQRHWLAAWEPYAAAALAAVVFLPNVVWNMRHGLVSYLFQLNHGMAGGRWPRFDFLGEFIGGQAGVVTPIVFGLIWLAAAVRIKTIWRDSRLLFLLVFFLVPFVFFGWSSLGKQSEANWAGAAYLSGLLLLVWHVETAPAYARSWRIATLAGTGVAVALSLAVLVHAERPFLPIPAHSDTTAQLRGWKEFARRVETVRDRIDPGHRMTVCANSYQIASELAFYLPDRPRTFSLNIAARPNQYSMLRSRDSLAGRPLLFVDNLQPGVDATLRRFASFEPVDTVPMITTFFNEKTAGVYKAWLSQPPGNAP